MYSKRVSEVGSFVSYDLRQLFRFNAETVPKMLEPVRDLIPSSGILQS